MSMLPTLALKTSKKLCKKTSIKNHIKEYRLGPSLSQSQVSSTPVLQPSAIPVQLGTSGPRMVMFV